MHEELRKVMIDRLMQHPPEGCTVVPGSTPVFGFGRIHNGRVASVSLNPSYREFDPVKGKLRFHNLESLGLKSYDDLTEEHLDPIMDYCERYFERRIHFKRYFGQLERFIQQFLPAVSYLDGSLCHLDISQWATNSVWSKLSARQKDRIVSPNDIDLIRSLIQHSPYEVLLLNGATAATVVLGTFFNVPYDKVDLPAQEKVTCYYAEFDSLLGVPLGRTVRCYGWNRVVHQANKKEYRELILDWIKEKMEKKDEEEGLPK